MHAPYDKSRNSSPRTELKGHVALLILPAILAVVLTVLTVLNPKVSAWVAQAAQAEIAGGFAADLPVETAQPGMLTPMRTVHAD